MSLPSANSLLTILGGTSLFTGVVLRFKPKYRLLGVLLIVIWVLANDAPSDNSWVAANPASRYLMLIGGCFLVFSLFIYILHQPVS